MSDKSNNLGRAYEYAWLSVLAESLKMLDLELVKNSNLEANLRAWNSLQTEEQEIFITSAKAAIKTILELEPKILEEKGILSLECQKDNLGIKGDVRDILLKRESLSWEIGLSIKHNHEAVKHSRLSHKLDFGKEWFNLPCSQDYWQEVKPIFDFLMQGKTKGQKWAELPNKEDLIYVPLLNAFMAEIKRANQTNNLIAPKLVEYLIGVNDYYKIVSHDKRKITFIHSFNIHKTLNQPSENKISAITVPIVELPTEIVAIRFKTNSKNTVEIYLNNGWQLSFRLHNASSKIEPSLKFDVQFIGMPLSVLSIECRW